MECVQVLRELLRVKIRQRLCIGEELVQGFVDGGICAHLSQAFSQAVQGQYQAFCSTCMNCVWNAFVFEIIARSGELLNCFCNSWRRIIFLVGRSKRTWILCKTIKGPLDVLNAPGAV